MNTPIIIATRGSELALWQARHIQSLLEGRGINSELKIIKTQGDKIQNVSLEKLEGKGFFTKEIEDALINNQADLAVHSHKDLPTESHPDLIVAAVTEREDPSELLVAAKGSLASGKRTGLASLKKNAVVGTSSSRRKSQLLAFRPDFQMKDLRGNVPTRVEKLRRGDYDAILIAAAGAERLELDLSDLHSEKLDPREFIPAPAQGVLALQIRKSDKELLELLRPLNKIQTSVLTEMERRVLRLFGGGCHAPLGAFAEFDPEKELWKMRVAHSDSWDRMPVSIYVESQQPEVLAQRAYEKIKNTRPQSVFISRNKKSDDYFFNVLLANGFSVEGSPFIEFKPVALRPVPETDWIFFASRHAVKYFFIQKPVISHQRFGCVGKATSDELRKYNHRSAFIGDANDTRITGKKFASLVGNGTVLFPQAKGSMQSIQRQFVKKENLFDLVVYETVQNRQDFKNRSFDIFVFTSPSNVEAYLKNNSLKRAQKLVAMGEATANELRKAGYVSSIIPDAFDDAALARAVFSYSSLEVPR